MFVPKISNQLTKRAVVIGALALVMLIPLGMVGNVIHERNYYYDGVVADISSLWGARQILVGPVLLVPFSEVYVSKEKVENESGELETKSKTHYVQRTALFLPKVQRLNGEIQEHYRTRGIYDSLVYASSIHIDAEFSPPAFDELTDHLHEIQWDKARVAVGLSDTKAIDDKITLERDKNVAVGNAWRAALPVITGQ